LRYWIGSLGRPEAISFSHFSARPLNVGAFSLLIRVGVARDRLLGHFLNTLCRPSATAYSDFFVSPRSSDTIRSRCVALVQPSSDFAFLSRRKRQTHPNRTLVSAACQLSYSGHESNARMYLLSFVALAKFDFISG
jgi:hypothetical protein